MLVVMLSLELQQVTSASLCNHFSIISKFHFGKAALMLKINAEVNETTRCLFFYIYIHIAVFSSQFYVNRCLQVLHTGPLTRTYDGKKTPAAGTTFPMLPRKCERACFPTAALRRPSLRRAHQLSADSTQG